MKLLAPQVIGQLDHVLRQARDRKLIRAGNLGLAVAAHIGAHDAKMPRQERDPLVEAARAAHRGMYEDQRFLRAPRIAEIVDGVAQLEPVARGHFLRGGR